MSDYTPTTEEVRYGYVANSSEMRSDKKLYEEFDRWLAEVKAQAWEEGATCRQQLLEMIAQNWIDYDGDNFSLMNWLTEIEEWAEGYDGKNPYRGENK